MNIQPVALKEWALAVEALLDGSQIMLLRKGGIAEETRRFELRSPSFYLLPTYEHQRAELVKEAYRPYYGRSMAQYKPESGHVQLKACAFAAEDLEIKDQAELAELFPYHMWTASFAEERLRWKAKEPLHVLLLRVYAMEAPCDLEMTDEYRGCRSWVELVPPPHTGELRPVLDDGEFERKCMEIRERLGR